VVTAVRGVIAAGTMALGVVTTMAFLVAIHIACLRQIGLVKKWMTLWMSLITMMALGVTKVLIEVHGVTKVLIEVHGVTEVLIEVHGVTKVLIEDHGVTEALTMALGVILLTMVHGAITATICRFQFPQSLIKQTLSNRII
jgi:hypothetical protein